MASLEYKENLIVNRRSGKGDDPYISVSQTLEVIAGRVQLAEIPSDFDKVTVTSSTPTTPVIDWVEVDYNTLTDTTYKVNYTFGYVEFHPNNNGKILKFDYKGTGATFLSADRIWVNADGSTVTETLKNVVENAEDSVTKANESLLLIISMGGMV